MRNKVIALIIILLTISSTLPAHAQTSVETVIIQNVNTDAESFPMISFNGLVFDSKGIPIPDVSSEMFSVAENGEPVTFEMLQVESGTRTSLVLDMGKWINNKSARNRELVKDKMQALATRIIDRMKDTDQLEIVAVYGLKPVVMSSFTGDKTTLRETIKNLDWNNEQASYGLEGIVRATSDLVDTPDDLFKRVIFVSSGIMMNDPVGKDEKEIVQDLLAEDIILYSVDITWQGSWDYYRQYESIANAAKGQFFKYVVDEDLIPLFALLDSNRTIYQFTFRSVASTGIERTISLNYLGASNVTDSKVYTVDSSFIALANIQILVNNGEPILLSAENSTASIPIHISIDGLGNREIKKITFYANGQEYGNLSATAPGRFSTNWQIPYELLSIGYTELLLEVVAEDELGGTHQGATAITVQIQPPADPLCRALSNLPGLGEACVNSGFTLAGLFNIILLLMLAALGVVVWFKRDTVLKAGKQIGTRVTHIVERLTNRLRKSEPKARLIALQGILEGSRMEFDLFGETAIGSTNESASLVFDNPNISRLHCTIHEGHAGNWTIEDQESTNGTYVNAQRLTRFVEKELESGDIIELAQVEYGGIKFRFEILDLFTNDIVSQYTDDEEEVAPVTQQGSTRSTQRFQPEENKGDKEAVIDPADPSNQKW